MRYSGLSSGMADRRELLWNLPDNYTGKSCHADNQSHLFQSHFSSASFWRNYNHGLTFNPTIKS
jgi:hypothetical protein